MHKIYVPQPHRFSKAEYHQMHDLGFFMDQYVELLDGEITDMPVPGNPHCVSTELMADILRDIFGKAYWIRVQMPLDLSESSEPMPDLSVVSGSPRSHTMTPKSAEIAVEVSETTLAMDRGRKTSLYAAGGITDYWIINLVDNQLEIHRNPVVDPNEPFGYRYANVTIHRSNDVVSPLARPQAAIQVSQLLP